MEADLNNKLKARLKNVEENKLKNLSDEKYYCKNCEYEGVLITNAGLSDTIHLSLVTGIPIIVLEFNLINIPEEYYSINIYTIILTLILMVIGYQIAKNIFPFYAQCPNCEIKTKNMFYGNANNIAKDTAFDSIEEKEKSTDIITQNKE